MPTSPIGCSTALRTNGRDPPVTPTKPSDVAAGWPEGGKVHGNREGSTGFKVGREETKIIGSSGEKKQQCL